MVRSSTTAARGEEAPRRTGGISSKGRKRGRAILTSLAAVAAIGVSVCVDAAAVYDVKDACGSMNFTETQEKHYGKSEFVKHADLAETVGNLLSVFYDEATDSWTIQPDDLKDVVLSNIHKVQGTQIYGSAIAFEPNVWRQTEGLEEGVVSSVQN
jgi:hypothetical protein